MKTITSFLVIISSLLLAGGCFPFKAIEGDGNVITETISVTDYDVIETSGSMNIHYTQSGDSPFLEVKTDKNIYDMYDFVIEEGHKLVIRPKKEHRHKFNFRPTTFEVKTRSITLREANIAGDSEFYVDSTLTTDDLKVGLAGSGTIFLQDTVRTPKIQTNIAGSAAAKITYIICDSFKGEIAGSGKIEVAGTANNANFEIAGSGDIQGFDLLVADMKAEIAGSGTINIHATNSIDVKGAGSGEVNYKGTPPHVSSSIAGSGKVKQVTE